LPFNCQWQELKDLMRGAGSVLRADIAQCPDGRSRGFGSVLFATPQDAERAVGMFNEYEFNGRALKVHFDKFSGASIHGNPNQNNGSSSPCSNGHHLQQQQHHQQQQHFVMPVPVPAYPQRTVSGFEQQQQQQQYQHSPQLQQSQQPQLSPLSSGGPFSPLHTRGLPPMAPSMPAFTSAIFAAPLRRLSTPGALFCPGFDIGGGAGTPGTPQRYYQQQAQYAQQQQYGYQAQQGQQQVQQVNCLRRLTHLPHR
ncbi:hypothetical protein JCM8097_003896, partial [Rhodosporidiobolus ruineniae]